MAKWGAVHCEGLKKLKDDLEKLQDRQKEQFFIAASREMAARLLSLVIPRTPVGHKPSYASPEARNTYWNGYVGGTLRRGWTARTETDASAGRGSPTAETVRAFADALTVRKAGNSYIVEVVNPVSYASYVEDGHRQTPGRYVPALGKALKQSAVPGRHMLKISEEDLRRIAPRILEQKLRRMLREGFDGGNR